jgi:hypothetical protein
VFPETQAESELESQLLGDKAAHSLSVTHSVLGTQTPSSSWKHYSLEQSKKVRPRFPECVSLQPSSPNGSAKILVVDVIERTPLKLNLPIRILLDYKLL